LVVGEASRLGSTTARMMELLEEARDELGFAHEGAVVLPCGVERWKPRERRIMTGRSHIFSYFGLFINNIL
jgi:hypothetical protein